MKQEDQPPTQLEKALVIYDGGCDFCEKWIELRSTEKSE